MLVETQGSAIAKYVDRSLKLPRATARLTTPGRYSLPGEGEKLDFESVTLWYMEGDMKIQHPEDPHPVTYWLATFSKSYNLSEPQFLHL